MSHDSKPRTLDDIEGIEMVDPSGNVCKVTLRHAGLPDGEKDPALRKAMLDKLVAKKRKAGWRDDAAAVEKRKADLAEAAASDKPVVPWVAP